MQNYLGQVDGNTIFLLPGCGPGVMGNLTSLFFVSRACKYSLEKVASPSKRIVSPSTPLDNFASVKYVTEMLGTYPIAGIHETVRYCNVIYITCSRCGCNNTLQEA